MNKIKTPLVSVVIPTYNRDQSLKECLKSVFNQNYPNYEIIVIDQSDKKFPLKDQFIEKYQTKIRYFKLNTPSAGQARNVSIKNAQGEIIIFIDDDVIAEKNLISNHVKAYTDPKIGAIAGRVITIGQKIEEGRTDTGRITTLGRFTDGLSSKIKQEVMTVITCNASWKKDVLKKIGGFDENLSLIREDSDLSLRTIKAGYKIIFEPKALVIHKRAESGGFRKKDDRMKWYFGFFQSETYFFLKHWPKILVPFIIITRFNWALRCMFGFGREVSLRSITTPFLGILEGIKTFRRFKYGHRY